MHDEHETEAERSGGSETPDEGETQRSGGTEGASSQHPAKDNEITDEDRANPMVNDSSFTEEGEDRDSSC